MTPSLRAGRRCYGAIVILAVSGCIDTTGVEGDYADVVGLWDYTAQQAAPVRQLTGTLDVSEQVADLMSGSLSFTETDGLGGVTAAAGPATGRVIATTDVDFDVQLSSATRRHVGRFSANADTISGTWIALTGGLSGQFRLVRGVGP